MGNIITNMSVNNAATLALLNTSILTSEGNYSLKAITLSEAQSLVKETLQSSNNVLSAIGHQSTADILTTLLGINVPAARIEFAQLSGQKALVMKLNGRPPEGRVLTQEEIETIGFQFMLMTRME